MWGIGRIELNTSVYESEELEGRKHRSRIWRGKAECHHRTRQLSAEASGGVLTDSVYTGIYPILQLLRYLQ